MKVKLINYSQDPEGRNLLEQIAYCARVSNPANQDNSETAEKLVRYLIKNKHWSPLEMVSVCLEIETTRDIARQILRHRSFSFQEFSQRYAVADLGVQYREARLQDTKNRQNSIEIKGWTVGEQTLIEEWRRKQDDVLREVAFAYDWALSKGIAKEQARAVLPEGNTESTMIMSGSLRSWVHYCQLRMDKATQKEHRIIAEQCWEIIMHHFPDVQKALESN